MKKSEKFIYHSAAYTVAISIFFFLFARMMQIEELSISFARYFTIIAFSFVLSASEFIFDIKKLPGYLKHIIHYAVLAIAFFVVFLTVQNESGDYEFKVTAVFAAVIIFSVLYLIITMVYIFALKPRFTKSKKAASANEKTSSYQPRFK